MPQLTLAQALIALDALTYEAEILADIAGQGADFTGYDEFSTAKALVAEQGRARAALAQIRVVLVRLLDPATAPSAGADWVYDHFGGFFDEVPNPALTAQGTLVVSVASGLGPYAYQAGDLLVEDIATGQYYTNTNAAPSKVTFGTPATLTFEAQTAGVAGNPLAFASFRLVSGPAGGSLGVTVSTWTKTRGGVDIEGAAAFISRCISKWGTRGYGANLDAFDYWIPTGTPAVTRWYVRDDNPGGPGTIWVFVADAAGAGTVGEVASVRAYLLPRKPLGSGALGVFSAPVHTLQVTAASTLDGTNPSALANQAAALQLLRGACPLGATIDPALLYELLRGAVVATADIAVGAKSETVTIGAPGFTGVVGVALSLPAAAVSLAGGEVLDISASLS